MFDPLSSFVSGKIDLHREQDARRVLSLLKGIAERTGTAIVIIRHLNKALGSSAMHRGLGSVGIGAAARQVLHFGQHPDAQDQGVMAVAKSNIAPRASSITYRVVPSPNDPSLPVVEWDGFVNYTADDLVSGNLRESPQLDRAIELWEEMLSNGSEWKSGIDQRFEDEGISPATAKRAKRILGVVSEKDRRSPDGGWYCHLPTSDT